MRHLFYAIIVFSLVGTASAQQTNYKQQDRWLSLFEYAQVTPEAIKNVAPHFPKTEIKDEKSYKEFTEKLTGWKRKYVNEVEAILALPDIKKLNPSRVHLGLQTATEPRKFENSYWQWVQAAGLSINEVRAFAPNFPAPRITSNLAQSEAVYDAALQDWMKLFPKEHEALLNNPVLMTQKKFKDPVLIETSNAELFTKMDVQEMQPAPSDYNSGNEGLDKVRYELALKHWYFKYNPAEYVKLYDVKEYHKNVEEK